VEVSAHILSHFPYEPTTGQKQLFLLFDGFLKPAEKKGTVLIRGYAGTGKTTIVHALVKVLPRYDYKYVLLAPTGRAAKVLAAYSERRAFTIHKVIYRQTKDSRTGEIRFVKQKNYFRKAIFIVDEASMIPERNSFSARGLLKDLISFVFEHTSNKLVLIGDSAQLPPVGLEISLALDKGYLERNYGLNVREVELREVVRQEAASGILENATRLRNALQSGDLQFHLKTKGLGDVFRMTHEKLEEGLRYAYDKYGQEEAIIICRSNWQAVQYNQFIRRTIFFYEDEVQAGDILMIVKNNYFFLDDDAPAGFIANGDFVELRKIVSFEEKFGYRFAVLDLQMLDYPEMEPFRATVILDTLQSKTPALTEEENRKLYEAALQEYLDSGMSPREAAEAVRKDEYVHALQIKFAYALTCHKSQGGQWKIVFLDQGYRKEQETDREYVRWLYTAFTRAEKELYLINFPDVFFEQ
jgi:exodeoxyribonuclease-5